MSDGEAMLRAVCERPFCRTTRCAYQDWLDEYDADWGARLLDLGFTPTPVQRAFLNSAAVSAAFVGPEVAGGKTTALVMATLQGVDRPDYHAALVVLPTLVERMTDYLHQHAGTRGAGRSQAVRFPSGATVLVLSHRAGRLADELRGYRLSFVGVDDLGMVADRGALADVLDAVRPPAGATFPFRLRFATSSPSALPDDCVRFVQPDFMPVAR